MEFLTATQSIKNQKKSRPPILKREEKNNEQHFILQSQEISNRLFCTQTQDSNPVLTNETPIPHMQKHNLATPALKVISFFFFLNSFCLFVSQKFSKIYTLLFFEKDNIEHW
jgi:hypothetical protein